jgi:hypothetical protein
VRCVANGTFLPWQDHHLEKEKIKEDVTEMNKVFYCDICSKQYTQALQFDQHLSSYDHHHKKVRQDRGTIAQVLDSLARLRGGTIATGGYDKAGQGDEEGLW